MTQPGAGPPRAQVQPKHLAVNADGASRKPLRRQRLVLSTAAAAQLETQQRRFRLAFRVVQKELRHTDLRVGTRLLLLVPPPGRRRHHLEHEVRRLGRLPHHVRTAVPVRHAKHHVQVWRQGRVARVLLRVVVAVPVDELIGTHQYVRPVAPVPSQALEAVHDGDELARVEGHRYLLTLGQAQFVGAGRPAQRGAVDRPRRHASRHWRTERETGFAQRFGHGSTPCARRQGRRSPRHRL